MNSIKLKANAKINISLDIIKKREDGYHDIKTIMQTVKLHDNIVIKKIKSNYIKITTNIKYLPTDRKNLCYKAAELLIKNYNITSGILININKKIPICAGLGGGSSDCAETLKGIVKLFNLDLKKQELIDISKSLGADIPYFINKGTVLAEGIGEKLTTLKQHPYIYILLVKPNIAISTKYIFDNFNIDDIKKRPRTDVIINAIENRDIETIGKNFVNVLESFTIKKYKIIDDIKYIMNKNGALGSSMSGSGPTVFGYFKKKREIYKTIYDIKINIKNIKEIYITEIFNT